jgi:acyl transferase domain-containing protein
MSDFLQRIAKLSPKRLALLALDLQTRLEAAERTRTEPVAIIGIGCRFPGGVNGPDDYWQLLQEGRDAISDVPRERWDIDKYYDPNPDAPGKMATRYGGFIEGIDQFDPQFFGISPREAASMDPQQRLVLEVTWEALEHAGQAPDRLAESQTGVFLGVCASDYFQILLRGEGGPSNTYLATGTSHSIASGRLSYVLGLRGPSLSIDTACSSSLVATHLACQSLLAGESRMAIAGGVNAILEPVTTIALSTARMMAPDGRCKAFDAAADGFVRAEGCGIVVLKRLSDAIADGDRVIAVIAGSAINQDGRSNGLTAPNGRSQEAVLRAALARAGCAAHEIDYVEAHGTGTSLGDPIEVRALAAVLGERPAEHPLRIGSVKTNFGHLEAAAGIAGLIKTALSLDREEIPRQLHVRQLNPHLPWSQLPIEVATHARPWRRGTTRRFAGVSSFGFSGTNAHVILGEAPKSAARAAAPERPLHVAVVSARTPQALRRSAGQLAQHLNERGELSLTDVCFTSNVGRAQLAHRAAMIVGTVGELQEELRALADGTPASRTVSGHLQSPEPPAVAFLFTGQGSQYAEMGRQLYDTQPVFRRALDECAEILRPSLAEPLHSVLWGDAAARIDETRYTQPALFALEYALSELWKSWGVVPALAIGHSLGEYVAACVASVFSLEDALKLVVARARLMQALPSGGAMASIALSEPAVADLLVSTGSRVSIAAVNAPDQTVVSGAATDVERVIAEAVKAGARVHRLTVSHAFHSPLIEPMLDQFEAIASEVRYAPPRIGVVSNLTGRLAGPETLASAKYWRRHAREAVRFADGMRTLRDQGCRLFLEIGPAPVLLGMGRAAVDDQRSRWLPSIRKGRGEWEEMLQSLCALYMEGVQIDWAGFDRDYARQRVTLPTYPFEHESYWIGPSSAAATASVDEASGSAAGRPRSGSTVTRIDSAHGETIYPQSLGLRSAPYLGDHRFQGRILVPAPVYIAMAARAAMELETVASSTIRDVVVSEPLVIDDDATVDAQVIVGKLQHGEASFEVFVRNANESSGGWACHASGVIEPGADRPATTSDSLSERRKGLGDALDGATYYAALQEQGVSFGPSFQVIDELWRQDGTAVARMHAPDGGQGADLHPAVLDACFQLVAAALPGGGAHTATADSYLMVGLESVKWSRAGAGELWGYARLRSGAPNVDVAHGDVELHDQSGTPIVVVTGLRLKRGQRDALLRGVRGDKAKWLHGIEWRERPADPAAATRPSSDEPRWFVVVGESAEATMAVADAIRARGDVASIAVAGTTALETAEAAATLISTTCGAVDRLDGVIYLASEPANDGLTLDHVADAATRGCRDVLHLVQAFASRESHAGPRLWIVTTRVQLAGDRDLPPTAAPLWGLGRTIGMEHPEFWGGLIDVDDLVGAAQAIAREVTAGGRREEVALRGEQRYVSRLVRSRAPLPERAAPIASDATYLITGGSGGIGIRVAEWLVEQGAMHLVLVSRGGGSQDIADAIHGLSRHGADVRVRRGDVANVADMTRIFDEIRDTMPSLRGVIHSAGIVDDRVLMRHDAARFARVLAPKVSGSWVLHTLTRILSLDFFVMFSSAASVLAPVGLGNYAAANAFLDALAHHRRALGLPGVSINWAAWERTGMAAAVGERRQSQWTQGGLAPMTAAEGVDVLGWLLHGHLTQAAVLPIDWRSYFQHIGEARVSALLEDVTPDAERGATASASAESFIDGLLRLPQAARMNAVMELVTAEVRTVLGFRSGHVIDPTQGLFDLGMDSLTAVELRNRLQNRVGRTVAGTVVFDYPSVEALTTHLMQVVLGSESAAAPGMVAKRPDLSSHGANLDDLSEDDLAAMLAQKLGQLR